MTTQVKDSAYYNFFIDNPENHSLQINGEMKNNDTTFRFRKYCKSQKVDVRFPWNETKVHFRVLDHNDIKIGLDFGKWKLGKFEANYFTKVGSINKKLNYSFGLSRQENSKYWHSVWFQLNQGLFVNYNFNFKQQNWYSRNSIHVDVENNIISYDQLFNYTRNLNEFFFRASNDLNSTFQCKNQSFTFGYLRRRGNDKACGFLLDNNLNLKLLCHAKIKKYDWRILLNQKLELKQFVRYNYSDKIVVQTGLNIPLLSLKKTCPCSYLTALQVELNI